MTEYIAEVRIDTDGDWHWTNDYRNLVDSFENDGGFDGPVKFFDEMEPAIDAIVEILGCAVNGGIYRSEDRQFESDHYFTDGLANILDIFTDDDLVESIKHDIENGLGGIRVECENGNWSATIALYARDGGRIGEVYDMWVSNVRE